MNPPAHVPVDFIGSMTIRKIPDRNGTFTFAFSRANEGESIGAFLIGCCILDGWRVLDVRIDDLDRNVVTICGAGDLESLNAKARRVVERWQN